MTATKHNFSEMSKPNAAEPIDDGGDGTGLPMETTLEELVAMINPSKEPISITKLRLKEAMDLALADPKVESMLISIQHAPEPDPETGAPYHPALQIIKTNPGVNMTNQLDSFTGKLIQRLMATDPAYALHFVEFSIRHFFQYMSSLLSNPSPEDLAEFDNASSRVLTKLAESAFYTVDFPNLMHSYCEQLAELRKEHPEIGETATERVLADMAKTQTSPKYMQYRELVTRLIAELTPDQRQLVINHLSENAYAIEIDTLDLDAFERDLTKFIATL